MVIRELISDLLGELNEKELEIPFRSLLRSAGHSTIFERTRHGVGEHGKDIVSLININRTRTVCVCQLKTRDISTRRFRREVKPELDAMIQVPIRHPMIKGTEPRKYILVSAGDLSPDAAEEFDAYNKHNLAKGDPEVELLNRPKLVAFFHQNMASLSIFTDQLRDSLARPWLDIKSTKYNRADWFDFVDKVLSLNAPSDNRSLLLLGLATAFLASQARLQNQFFVSCDVFRIALVKMWSILREQDENATIFDQLHEEYCRLIEDFIEAKTEDLSREKGLFHGKNGVIESILYPIRTFSILGTLSYLASFYGEKGQKKKEYQLVELIETIIRNNPSTLTPPTDSLRKDIAVTLTELCRNKKSAFAKEWIKRLLNNLHQRFILSGWWPSESNKPADIIENTFHFGGERKKQHESYLIPILFRFCAKLRAKNLYDFYRACFDETSFKLLEFLPPDDTALAESELIQGSLEHGTVFERKFPRSFDEYCGQVSQIAFKEYSPIKKKRPYILHMITEVHSHYVFPEIYLRFNIN